MKRIVLTAMTAIIFASDLLAVNREQVVISELLISPEVENFDCHGSCIIEVAPGIICAAWKGGPGKGASTIDMKQNVGIWVAYFTDGKWGPARQLVEAPNSVCWGPVLTQCPDGELALFYRMGNDPRHCLSLMKRSNDLGKTWSEPELLPAGIVGPTRSKPLYDAASNMICGSSVEIGEADNDLKATACWIEIFSPETQLWSKHGPLEIPEKRFGSIEPVLFWCHDGRLKLLCRDRSHRIGLKGWIWESESKDCGKTWTTLQKTALPNPDAGIEVVSLGNGIFLLIYNQSHTTRYPLSLALSRDDGASWIPLLDLEKETGEFPSATMDKQGLVHITYAWSSTPHAQRRIKHLVLDPTKLF